MSGITCRWFEGRLTEAGEGLGGPLRRALLRRHLGGCERCQAFERDLTRLDGRLRELTSNPVPTPGDDLRPRVIAGFHRQIAAGDDQLPRARGWLESFAWAAGGIAVASLVGSLIVSRLDEFGPPPRTVRVELPSGYAVVGEPAVVVRRASGEEEVR